MKKKNIIIIAVAVVILFIGVFSYITLFTGHKEDASVSFSVNAGDNKIKIALASVHNYEEPCISGKNGSGTVFFSNCNLNCIYCQNYEISQLGKGKKITIEHLAQIFIKQQEKNVNNNEENE